MKPTGVHNLIGHTSTVVTTIIFVLSVQCGLCVVLLGLSDVFSQSRGKVKNVNPP